jgi:hypothetical protein
LASFASERHVAEQCLEKHAFANFGFADFSNGRLATTLLERINNAPHAPTTD